MSFRDNYLFSHFDFSNHSERDVVFETPVMRNAEEEPSSWGERFRKWLEERYGQQDNNDPETPEQPEQPETPTQPNELLAEYTSAAEGSEFNVHINFVGDHWTPELQQAFIDSADYLSTVITGDLRDINSYGYNVDDISITAELVNMDGYGGKLGHAGPVNLRSDNNLPFTASMQFDIADAESLLRSDGWMDTVLHEMTHALGFGSIWGYQGLISGTTFTGENATAVYEELFEIENAGGVPTDSYGGHWSETVLGSDLMSPYLNYGSEAELSTLTLAALEDMGYDTVFDMDTFLAA